MNNEDVERARGENTSALSEWELTEISHAIERGIKQGKRPGKSDRVLFSARAIQKLLATERARGLRQLRDDFIEHVCDWRDVEIKDICPECGGAGKQPYASTATWHGGVGGQMITTDVCDKCWGSGSKSQPWPSWRTRNVEAERADRAKGLEEAAQWHEKARLQLNGPDYGLSSEGKRRQMRETYRFHTECAAAIRSLIEKEQP